MTWVCFDCCLVRPLCSIILLQMAVKQDGTISHCEGVLWSELKHAIVAIQRLIVLSANTLLKLSIKAHI
jgi:hypothetical protein